MPGRFSVFPTAALIVLLVSVSTPTLAGHFAFAHQDCLNAFKGQPAATALCVPETRGYRACIADHALGLHHGDVVIPGGRLTTVPAECTPFEDVMQRCIIQHLNQAMPMPTPTPAPTVQGVAGLWKISQSNGYHGTLDLE